MVHNYFRTMVCRGLSANSTRHPRQRHCYSAPTHDQRPVLAWEGLRMWWGIRHSLPLAHLRATGPFARTGVPGLHSLPHTGGITAGPSPRETTRLPLLTLEGLHTACAYMGAGCCRSPCSTGCGKPPVTGSVVVPRPPVESPRHPSIQRSAPRFHRVRPPNSR